MCHPAAGIDSATALRTHPLEVVVIRHQTYPVGGQ
jgi:hypothetical protein